ncbi:hypothetical protein D9M71_626610 [compost metagenome]
MLLGRRRGAAVLQQHHVEIAVVGVAYCSLHHRLGTHPAAVDALDALALEQQIQLGLVERRDAVLDDVPLAGLRRQRLVHLAAPGIHLEDAVFGDRAEHLRVRVGLAVVVGEGHAHEGHRDALAARLVDGRGGARDDLARAHLLAQRRLAAGAVFVDQVVLHVQNQINALHCFKSLLG